MFTPHLKESSSSSYFLLFFSPLNKKKKKERKEITSEEVPTSETHVSMLRDPKTYPDKSLIRLSICEMQLPPIQMICLLVQTLRPRWTWKLELKVISF